MIFVLDTCNEVRRVVGAYLREPGVTQTAFFPALNFQSKQPRDFQSKNSVLAGDISRVDHALYIFFQKLMVL